MCVCRPLTAVQDPDIPVETHDSCDQDMPLLSKDGLVCLGAFASLTASWLAACCAVHLQGSASASCPTPVTLMPGGVLQQVAKVEAGSFLKQGEEAPPRGDDTVYFCVADRCGTSGRLNRHLELAWHRPVTVSEARRWRCTVKQVQAGPRRRRPLRCNSPRPDC